MSKKKANGSSLDRQRDLTKRNKARRAKRRAARSAKESKDPKFARRQEYRRSNNIGNYNIGPQVLFPPRHRPLFEQLGVDEAAVKLLHNSFFPTERIKHDIDPG